MQFDFVICTARGLTVALRRLHIFMASFEWCTESLSSPGWPKRGNENASG